MTGLLDVVWLVVCALDDAGIRYSVGGSLASSVSGEPRASIDADVLIDVSPSRVRSVVAALGPEFYADEGAIARAVASGTSANVIHRPSSIKVDLFIARTKLDTLQLARRQRIVLDREHDREIYVHSSEDILLQKLHGYRLGGEVSDRRWRDVLGILVARNVGSRVRSTSRR